MRERDHAASFSCTLYAEVQKQVYRWRDAQIFDVIQWELQQHNMYSIPSSNTQAHALLPHSRKILMTNSETVSIVADTDPETIPTTQARNNNTMEQCAATCYGVKRERESSTCSGRGSCLTMSAARSFWPCSTAQHSTGAGSDPSRSCGQRAASDSTGCNALPCTHRVLIMCFTLLTGMGEHSKDHPLYIDAEVKRMEIEPCLRAITQ